MLSQNSSSINWQFLLLGLFYIIMQCDARAVNVSNTWTMPQEGLNVFYRFFRDRISWFEADAVCQFHHANLVTVDNSFQFDATRDLLRELDVNDIVWIGLMRPQSSDRFMWSNSRPLVADTGYWAESLPLMDAPLCAVIDPIRDYRWHALRCGGPETASFLCEMPVPSWADACNLKDMPNLTLQYMADTASIELIRNCQEEGLLRTMCRGKQDRERALQDLICPRERLEAQRINDITNSHFKSLQIINSIPTDNNENNDIELLPMEVNYGPHYPEELQTEKNTVQRLIEQFNVDELMQADEPSNMETVSSFYKIPGQIPKPVKKSAKKVLENPKKESAKQKGMAVVQLQKEKKRLPIEIEEMMMGDQPQGEPEMPEQLLNEDVSNEILEPLPHIKKTNMYKEDMGKMEKEAIAMKENMQKSKEMEHKKMMMGTASTSTEATTTRSSSTTSATTTTTSQKPADISREDSTTLHEETTHKHFPHEFHPDHDASLGHLTTTPPSATIGHPMHPQQPRTNAPVEETPHPHIVESTDNSHFIPPMLMVKSHYVPSNGKHGHNEHHHVEHLETTTEDQEKTTLKHDHNQTLEMVVTTTPKVLELEKTTFKSFDTKQEQMEKEVATVTITSRPSEQITTDNGSIKPITLLPEQQQNQQHQTEAEQDLHKTTQNLNFEEMQTTMTVTTLQPVSSSSSSLAMSTKLEGTTSQTTTEQKYKKDSNDHDMEDETQELKPQTTDMETTQTTKLSETTMSVTTEKSLKPTEKLHELLTENLKTETTQASATQTEKNVATQTAAMEEQPQQQHEKHQQQHSFTEEKHVTKEKEKMEKRDEQQQQQKEKIATTETAELTESETEQQHKQTQTEIHNVQTETSVVTKKSLEEEKQEITPKTDTDKQETIKTTTDILQTSRATTTTTHSTPTQTTSATSSSSSTTTTTTVKPITITTKQNVDDTTFTTLTSTSTISTPTSTPSLSTSSSTLPPPPSSSTSFTPTSPTTPQPPETTTRNFLKVTTEEPFKPNRRRSLTKPETVSYMKKILG